MEVVPQNIMERFFAVIVLLVAFVVSASVVSKITSSMTHLEIVTAHQSERLQALKQYLVDHRISGRVAMRVQRNAQYSLNQQKRNTPESGIELLALVSEPLRKELHYEIYMPGLAVHPFFKHFADRYPATMRLICHIGISSLELTRGDVLFSEGDVPPVPQVYFLDGCRSRLTYVHRTGVDEMTNGWACEAVLWTVWMHAGHMRAKSECKLLVLDAGRFQSITASSHWAQVKEYGASFTEMLNNTAPEDLTDLVHRQMDLEAMVTHCLAC